MSVIEKFLLRKHFQTVFWMCCGHRFGICHFLISWYSLGLGSSHKYGQRYQKLADAPDVVGEASVGIHGADPSHGAGRRTVLRHVHVVSRPGEPWRLICIQHCDSDGGAVLEGASAQEPRVHHRVEDLHREGVGAPALIIHRLRGTREELEMTVMCRVNKDLPRYPNGEVGRNQRQGSLTSSASFQKLCFKAGGLLRRSMQVNGKKKNRDNKDLKVLIV